MRILSTLSRAANRRFSTDPIDGDGRPSVCVVGSGWAFLSGITVYSCRLANALAEDYRVSAVLMRRLLPRRLYPGADRVGLDLMNLSYRKEVTVFDGIDYFWVPSMLRGIAFIWRQHPQTVLLQWWTGTVLHSYLVLGVVARLRGARVVLEFHEVLDTAEASRLLPRLYVNALLRPLLALASAFVVHSEFDRVAVERQYKTGGRPVQVVPHGPYDHLESALDRRASSRPPHDGVLTVLYFGTIRPYKGVEDLVSAFDLLDPEQAAQYRLVVVGETWEQWVLPGHLIASSPYRDRIEFVNRYVDDDEVGAYFAEADAVVLPYLRSSSSGPLHVTMSHGLPVVVTAVGGLVEAAAGYEGAKFVPPHDVEALRAALLDLPSMAGRRYADPHSWARSVELLRAALFGGIGKRAGS